MLVLRMQKRASGIEATLVCVASSRPARLHSEVSHKRKRERRKKVDGARIGEEVGRCSSCCS